MVFYGGGDRRERRTHSCTAHTARAEALPCVTCARCVHYFRGSVRRAFADARSSPCAQEFYSRECTAPIHVAVDTAFVNEGKAIRVRARPLRALPGRTDAVGLPTGSPQRNRLPARGWRLFLQLTVTSRRPASNSTPLRAGLDRGPAHVRGGVSGDEFR